MSGQEEELCIPHFDELLQEVDGETRTCCKCGRADGGLKGSAVGGEVG